MRRILVVTAIVAAGLVATTANARSLHALGGSVDSGGRLSFVVKVKHGKPTTFSAPEWQDVPISCDGGGNLTSAANLLHGKAKIKHRKATFVHKFHNGLEAKIHAKFNKHATNAHGTLRVSGEVGGGVGSCDTGTQNWTAERQ